jgi:hypothetical protein
MARVSIPAAGFVLAAVAAASACGKGPTSPDPNPPPGGPTVTITSTGASPRALEIPLGGRLTIVNNDAVAHDMGSDPHPSHEDCPELNQIGMLDPGQRRTSGNLVEARVCGMHDHLRPLVTSLQLRLTIK